ncbi:MAG: hypothetical protein ACHQ1H_11310, partial [Nitrososphaerales archaeon]
TIVLQLGGLQLELTIDTGFGGAILIRISPFPITWIVEYIDARQLSRGHARFQTSTTVHRKD